MCGSEVLVSTGLCFPSLSRRPWADQKEGNNRRADLSEWRLTPQSKGASEGRGEEGRASHCSQTPDTVQINALCVYSAKLFYFLVFLRCPNRSLRPHFLLLQLASSRCEAGALRGLAGLHPTVV